MGSSVNLNYWNEKTNAINSAVHNASQEVRNYIGNTVKDIENEVSKRTFRVSSELRNSALFVLRGQRNGKFYRVPFTKAIYRASAPGEPPAVRTGIFRVSWGQRVHVEKTDSGFKAVASIESNVKTDNGTALLGDILEKGTSKMQPRPYKHRVVDRALPKIRDIYSKSYNK